LTRGGKKGQKKKTGDPFLKKEWYDLKAPSMFSKRNCGKTLVSKTQGTKIASAGLQHRVCEINLGDLYEDTSNAGTGQDEDQGCKKMKLSVEDVQGRNCLLDFHGMCYTRDKLCYFVRKWQTLIEGNVDVKTTDGYSIRVFCIGFTTTRHNQRKANCYAQTSQIRKIRKRMVDTIQEECSKSSLKENVKKLIASSMYREIEKKCERVFPLKDVCIRKVKVLKKPKFDITKLMEVHQGEEGDGGVDMLRPEAEEAKNVLAAEANA